MTTSRNLERQSAGFKNRVTPPKPAGRSARHMYLQQSVIGGADCFNLLSQNFRFGPPIGKDAIVLTHPSDPNLQIEVSAMWDRVKPGGAIRVMVSTFELQLQRFRVKVPTKSLLVFGDGQVDTFDHDQT